MVENLLESFAEIERERLRDLPDEWDDLASGHLTKEEAVARARVRNLDEEEISLRCDLFLPPSEAFDAELVETLLTIGAAGRRVP